ncbi:MAG: hypothetical protein Q9220_006420 [cf. Caloplaca sp. 1 TL-2023]
MPTTYLHLTTLAALRGWIMSGQCRNRQLANTLIINETNYNLLSKMGHVLGKFQEWKPNEKPPAAWAFVAMMIDENQGQTADSALTLLFDTLKSQPRIVEVYDGLVHGIIDKKTGEAQALSFAQALDGLMDAAYSFQKEDSPDAPNNFTAAREKFSSCLNPTYMENTFG